MITFATCLRGQKDKIAGNAVETLLSENCEHPASWNYPIGRSASAIRNYRLPRQDERAKYTTVDTRNDPA